MIALQGIDGNQERNNENDGKPYIKPIQSKARGHDQVKVIFDNNTKASSLKEPTRYIDKWEGNTI